VDRGNLSLSGVEREDGESLVLNGSGFYETSLRTIRALAQPAPTSSGIMAVVAH
jgi:hypothetical protein